MFKRFEPNPGWSVGEPSTRPILARFGRPTVLTTALDGVSRFRGYGVKNLGFSSMSDPLHDEGLLFNLTGDVVPWSPDD